MKDLERNGENASTIFARSGWSDLYWDELGTRITGWFSGLQGDDLTWHLIGGGLAYDLVTAYGDSGLNITDEDELLNIRLAAAVSDGAWTSWNMDHYVPVKMTITTNSCEETTVKTINNYQLEKVKEENLDNTDFFLSLLKNSSGEYSRDATYDPNGKPVKYTTVYGNELEVGERLVNTSEMLYELLASSPHTQDKIYTAMIVALNKYKNEVGGIVDWSDYENQFSDEWETITDEAA